MKTISENWISYIEAPAREMLGEVVINNTTYTKEDKIISIKIERQMPKGKIAGAVISQKATIELTEQIPVSIGMAVQCKLGVKEDQSVEMMVFPNFYIEDIKVDNIKGKATITAYDAIHYYGSTTKVKDVLLIDGNFKPIGSAAQILSTLVLSIGLSGVIENDYTVYQNINYTEEAPVNLNGTETVKDVLGQWLEAFGLIGYVSNNSLKLQLPPQVHDATIGKNTQFNITINEPKACTRVVKETELGNNILVENQYADGDYIYVIKNNSFLEMLPDLTVTSILTEILENLAMNYYPYNIKWRGNPALDIGDAVKIQQKDNSYIITPYWGDVISYSGGLSATCDWDFNAETTVSSGNTITDSIKTASARVDKVNNRIDLAVEEANQRMASIEITAEGIDSRVTGVSTDTQAIEEALNAYKRTNDAAVDGLDNEIEGVRSSTNQLQDKYATIFSTTQELLDSQGKATQVTTTTATIDDEGITVAKSGSSIETTISENGMQVKDGSTIELTANAEGVIAHNLTADNYLIIDGLIRFQKYGSNRCGCYWIGG